MVAASAFFVYTKATYYNYGPLAQLVRAPAS